MMDLTGRLTESQAGYSHESDIQSVAESLNDSDNEESISATKKPVHPESEQTGKLSSIIFN
jgi:hypothetical protein